MKYFSQKKFLIIFDDFDQTILYKNVGLFAKFLVNANIQIDIVTNKSDRNVQLKLPNGINLIRLSTVKRRKWPQLDDPAFKEYLERNIGQYFGLWVYRGRTYTKWVLEQAYQNNLLTLVKLDSSSGLSNLSLFMSKLLPQKVMFNIMKVSRHFEFLKIFVLFRWYCLFDTPLVLASLILCETPEMFERMGKFFGKEKCFLFPNSLPVDEFQKIEEGFKKIGLSKVKQVISVGRLVKGKGFEKLIVAFSQIPQGIRKDWKLKIIGPFQDKSYVKSLRNIISTKKLSDKVFLTGGFYGKDLYREYFQSRIMAMAYPKPPNTHGYEGQPNVIGEAMFFRNCVISVDVGTVSYLLGKCGVLLASDNENTAAKALAKVMINQKLRKKLVQDARARIENYFNLDVVAANLFQKIKKLDYSVYLKDQRQDTIVGEYLKGPVFKYCDLLSKKLLKGVDFEKLTIIDVGCREFYTYDYFLEKFKNKIKGVDVGLEGLQFAKGKNAIDLDAHKIGDYFGSQKFDLILAFHVFEHMYDLELVLKHCNFILKSNGYLYFAVPIPAKNTRRGHWVDIQNEDEMVGLCKNYGFKPIFHKVYPPGIFRDEREMLGLFIKKD